MASTLTSSNAADVVSYTSGGTYSAWTGTLSGSYNDWTSITGASSCTNCSASFIDNGLFTVTGSAGVVSSTITTSSAYPLTINMLNSTALTGLELDVTGNLVFVITLSDGSTVTTAANAYSTPTFVTFDSPLQITTATIYTTGPSGALYDLSWGTADPTQLPTQPGGTGPVGPSATPEGTTFLLMGGGLLFLGRWMKKHSFQF
jgi:hypothetical protein